MSLYSLFSGANIAVSKPLLDYVFAPRSIPATYHTASQIITALSDKISAFLHNQNIFSLLGDFSNFKPLTAELEKIMLAADQLALLHLIIVAIIAIIIGKNTFFVGYRFLFINMRGKVMLELRNQVFNKYVRQSLAFFGKSQVGDAIVRIVSDTSILNDKLVLSFVNIIRDVFTIAVCVRIALIFNTRLFLISILVLPVFTIAIGFLGKKLKKYSKRIQTQSVRIFSNIEEVLNNIRIVKAFAKEDLEYTNFRKKSRNFFIFWRRSSLYESFSIPIAELSSGVIGATILIIGGRQVIAHPEVFSFGDFMAFLFAMFSILHPLKEISKAYANIKKAMVSLERVYGILNRDSDIKESLNPVHKTDFSQSIKCKNLSFSYKLGEPVLKNINLTIHKGETVALVGSSGSGKTTFINLISRMYDIDSGDIFIDDTPAKDIYLNDLRGMFGTVTQDSILFSDTVEANIAYGSHRPMTLTQVQKACQIAYADEFIKKLSDGYETILEAKASNLSGGQKQRLCIARAIVDNPPILIFDEATSALDTESEQYVQSAIEQATANRTVILIAHRLSTVLSADKIVVFDAGKIVGAAPHKELISSCPRYKQLYDLQFNSQH